MTRSKHIKKHKVPLSQAKYIVQSVDSKTDDCLDNSYNNQNDKQTINIAKDSTTKKTNPQGMRNMNKINTTSTNINIAILFVIAITLMLVPDVAEAARLDMSKTKSVIDSFAKGIGALCGVCATIMAIYTGFKFYKGGSPLADLTTNFWAIGAFATASAIGTFVGSLNIGG